MSGTLEELIAEIDSIKVSLTERELRVLTLRERLRAFQRGYLDRLTHSPQGYADDSVLAAILESVNADQLPTGQGTHLAVIIQHGIIKGEQYDRGRVRLTAPGQPAASVVVYETLNGITLPHAHFTAEHAQIVGDLIAQTQLWGMHNQIPLMPSLSDVDITRI